MKNLKIFLATGVLAIAAACGNPGPANVNFNTAALNTSTGNGAATPAATPADELVMGRSLYEQNCAGCHKEDGTGGKMTIEGKTLNVDDLTSDKIKKFDDAKIAKYIHDGVEDEGMPAFKDKLSEAQIREIVRYVQTGIQKMPSPAQKPAANP
jgi:mono/diheme cytochrome c family protein